MAHPQQRFTSLQILQLYSNPSSCSPIFCQEWASNTSRNSACSTENSGRGRPQYSTRVPHFFMARHALVSNTSHTLGTSQYQ